MSEPTVEPRTSRDRLRVLGAGAAAGMVGGAGMGLAARLAMRVFAVEIGSQPSFTVAGTFSILLLGLTTGGAFGILYGAVRRFLPGPTPIRGLLFGAVLVVLLVVPVFAVGIDEARPDPSLGFLLFAPSALLLGFVIAVVMSPIERHVARLGADGEAVLASVAILVGALGLLAIAGPLAGVYVAFVTRLIG